MLGLFSWRRQTWVNKHMTDWPEDVADGHLFERLRREEGEAFEDELVLVVVNDSRRLEWRFFIMKALSPEAAQLSINSKEGNQ